MTKEEMTKKIVDDAEDNDVKRDDHESMEFEHVKDAKSSWDAQTVDVATKEQMLEKQAIPNKEDEDGDQVDKDDDVKMEDDDEKKVIFPICNINFYCFHRCLGLVSVLFLYSISVSSPV